MEKFVENLLKTEKILLTMEKKLPIILRKGVFYAKKT